MKNGWQLPLAALGVIFLFAAFNARPINSAADIAAWVQGVGSLLAIGAAVWIYAKQYQDKKADDLSETRAFVQAVRTELDVFWTIYLRDVQPHLNDLLKHHFEIYAPLHADQLMAYRTAPAAIGKVNDEQLRDLTVKVHAVLWAMISGLELNTAMLREYEPIEPYAHQTGVGLAAEQMQSVLSNHRQRLKAHSRELSDLMPKFFAQADQWLESHPAR
jgi:hypothetical protein